MGWMLERIGRAIASYLDKPEHGFEPFVAPDPVALGQTIRPGDVLLVKGNSRISGAIKYLTQSTWSHAALYVGPIETRVGSPSAQEEILRIRHSSLFVPRDFDISPYFAVVKPTIEQGFDYRAVRWTDHPEPKFFDDLQVETS